MQNSTTEEKIKFSVEYMLVLYYGTFFTKKIHDDR